MPDASKITVLLADEDVLRREGLAAVLSGQNSFDIVCQVPDGIEALDRIRSLRPDIAVVDLNLPLLHGIELVRRVRGEAPGTRVIILAGTDSDDIVREVVRAGADGYLMKNGPARHLVDAISYVRDGGQYFSPQLRRDGRDRELLEEPTRVPAVREQERSRPRLRASRPTQLRERLREEVSGAVDGRDYEIMSLMADGIRPILDRLDEIDSRVSHMETGDEPVPSDPRGWLNTELARGAGVDVVPPGTETNLSRMIEDAVAARFRQMAGQLQEHIEETHVRTLENFVRNVQVKLVQRVSALEHNMSAQAEAVMQLQEYSRRTEDNLSRLISGVDQLAKDLPRRLNAAPAEPPTQQFPVQRPTPPRRSSSEHRPAPGDGVMKKVLAAVAMVVILAAAVWGVGRTFRRPGSVSAGNGSAPARLGDKRNPAAAGSADSKARLQAAKDYMDRKEYPMAEDLYRQVTGTDPGNIDALQGLASVLYRQNKMAEAAVVLDKLPKN